MSHLPSLMVTLFWALIYLATGTLLVRLWPAGRILFAVIVLGLFLRIGSFHFIGPYRPPPNWWVGLLLLEHAVALVLLWRSGVKEVLTPQYRAVVVPAAPTVKWKVGRVLALTMVAALIQLARRAFYIFA